MPFSKIFVGYDEGLMALTVHAFRLLSPSFLLAGFCIFISSFFTALNNGLISAIVSFLRTLVFRTGCVIVMPMLWDVDGIWWSMLVADALAFIVSVAFVIANR